MDNFEKHNQNPTNEDGQDPADIIGDTLVNLLNLAQMLQNMSPQKNVAGKSSQQESNSQSNNNNYSGTQQIGNGKSNYIPQEQHLFRDAFSVATRPAEKMPQTHASSNRTMQESPVMNNRYNAGSGACQIHGKQDVYQHSVCVHVCNRADYSGTSTFHLLDLFTFIYYQYRY